MSGPLELLGLPRHLLRLILFQSLEMSSLRAASRYLGGVVGGYSEDAAGPTFADLLEAELLRSGEFPRLRARGPLVRQFLVQFGAFLASSTRGTRKKDWREVYHLYRPPPVVMAVCRALATVIRGEAVSDEWGDVKLVLDRAIMSTASTQPSETHREAGLRLGSLDASVRFVLKQMHVHRSVSALLSSRLFGAAEGTILPSGDVARRCSLWAGHAAALLKALLALYDATAPRTEEERAVAVRLAMATPTLRFLRICAAVHGLPTEARKAAVQGRWRSAIAAADNEVAVYAIVRRMAGKEPSSLQRCVQQRVQEIRGGVP